ncbi:hypothetical protein JM98_02581, partial [Treponema putidum]
DEAKKHNENLPGMGGVFNVVNLHVYHYAGNNPVKYVDPDGKKTTIMIIHANSGWEKLLGGSHVAIHFSNPGKTSSGDFELPTLYDPSGSYMILNPAKQLYRPSSGVFSGEEASDLASYIKSVLDRDNDEYIIAYTINTTPAQEAKMIELADEYGDGSGFNCADYVSEVLKEVLGFKHTMSPGNLESQLKESKLVTEVKTYKKVVVDEK